MTDTERFSESTSWQNSPKSRDTSLPAMLDNISAPYRARIFKTTFLNNANFDLELEHICDTQSSTIQPPLLSHSAFSSGVSVGEHFYFLIYTVTSLLPQQEDGGNKQDFANTWAPRLNLTSPDSWHAPLPRLCPHRMRFSCRIMGVLNGPLRPIKCPCLWRSRLHSLLCSKV